MIGEAIVMNAMQFARVAGQIARFPLADGTR